MNATERKEAFKVIYRHAHKDFKGVVNGVKCLLIGRNGSVLVAMEDLTDEEIAARLPHALIKESARLLKK